MMNIEVQQLLNVLNVWLRSHGIRLTTNDNSAYGFVTVEAFGESDEDHAFPTIPHAVEWALNEARKRDRAAAHDAGLKGWLVDAIEDGGDDAR